MEQRSNDAAMKDVQSLLREVEYVAGMGHTATLKMNQLLLHHDWDHNMKRLLLHILIRVSQQLRQAKNRAAYPKKLSSVELLQEILRRSNDNF